LMVPLCLLLFASTASAASAVLGIDLGTNFIKAAIVKPGTPLDIVLTKDSKRKEAAALAFKPSSNGPVELGTFTERLYGGDALALAGRFPGDVYTNLKPLLGIAPNDESVIEEYTSRFPAIKTQKDKSSVSIKSGAFGDKEQPWTIEELLAMELRNIRTNAEVMTGKGSKVTDAVITVPAFYTADERRAIQRAADLAGLSVMGLISDGLAVGIDYSVKREFPNVSRGGKAEVHLILDMGASSTTATVLRFQARDVKDVGKFNKTVQEVAVLGSGWDRTLGGNSLNGLILDHMVSEFVEKPQAKSASITAADVKKHGRTASKLWKEAERARQVLSANSDVRSSFEGLYDDIDFTSKLSRSKFEELAASFAERVDGPVIQALEAAKVSFSDLDSVILHGGLIRTPFLQKRLESLVGKSTEIRSNVNADESAAFGAAFKAAGLSPSFRVKEIRDSESAVYAAGIIQSQSGKDRQQQLFTPTSLSGTPKQIQFKDKADFEFDIYQKVDGKDRIVQKIETKNLTASVKALNDNHGCATEDVATKFSIRLSPVDGLPEVVGGTVSCTVESTGKKGGIVDSVKGLFGGKKADQEPLKDDADATSSKSTSSTSSATASTTSGSTNKNKTETAKKESVPVIKTESINIKFTATPKGLAAPSDEETDRMVERLAAFSRSDKARIQREEAFNTLEGFTYRARDLLSDVGFGEASTEAVRSEISALLSSTGEWLYGEGANAPSNVLKDKLSEFKKLIDPVQKRREEAKTRPEQIKSLQTALNQTKTLIGSISEQVAKAAAEASSSVADAASSVTSAVSSESSGAKDDLDDLEEPETATSSSTSAKPSPSSYLPSYTQEDLTELTETYEAVSAWLTEKLAAQEKLPAYEDAALSLKDIEAKASSLQQSMMSLVRK
ncbi:actin-like ATPase domain-containing protein, partial [Myriangium duriaei CBS 260.36]